MLQASRNLTRGGHEKRIRPGNALANDAELPVGEARESARIGQVATDERQMVRLADAADLANALRRRRIVQMAAERVARIRRIGDDPAVTQDFGREPHQPRLRMRGVDGEELGHEAASTHSDI